MFEVNGDSAGVLCQTGSIIISRRAARSMCNHLGFEWQVIEPEDPMAMNRRLMLSHYLSATTGR
jgi:hypothetical protein